MLLFKFNNINDVENFNQENVIFKQSFVCFIVLLISLSKSLSNLATSARLSAWMSAAVIGLMGESSSCLRSFCLIRSFEQGLHLSFDLCFFSFFSFLSFFSFFSFLSFFGFFSSDGDFSTSYFLSLLLSLTLSSISTFFFSLSTVSSQAAVFASLCFFSYSNSLVSPFPTNSGFFFGAVRVG